jgi:hypothetical protein
MGKLIKKKTFEEKLKRKKKKRGKNITLEETKAFTRRGERELTNGNVGIK